MAEKPALNASLCKDPVLANVFLVSSTERLSTAKADLNNDGKKDEFVLITRSRDVLCKELDASEFAQIMKEKFKKFAKFNTSGDGKEVTISDRGWRAVMTRKDGLTQIDIVAASGLVAADTSYKTTVTNKTFKPGDAVTIGTQKDAWTVGVATFSEAITLKEDDSVESNPGQVHFLLLTKKGVEQARAGQEIQESEGKWVSLEQIGDVVSPAKK